MKTKELKIHRIKKKKFKLKISSMKKIKVSAMWIPLKDNKVNQLYLCKYFDRCSC